jgi:hypothetical protein
LTRTGSNFSVLNRLGPSREKLLKLGFGGLDDLLVHRLDLHRATSRSWSPETGSLR